MTQDDANVLILFILFGIIWAWFATRSMTNPPILSIRVDLLPAQAFLTINVSRICA